MKSFKEIIKEVDTKENYSVVLKGGSVGERNIRSARDLKRIRCN